MATAAGYTPMDDIPFVGMNNMPPISPNANMRSDTTSSTFESYYGHPPIYLGGSTANASVRMRRDQNTGITGDLAEFQSVFDACLQVGRIERAGALLKRMLKLDLPYSEARALQNRYLRASVEQIMMNPTEGAMQDLHKWFELQIRSAKFPMDLEMVAYMVKASLQSPKGRKERLVRRYMEMLDEESALELYKAEILTDHELSLITHIYPKYNYTSDIEAEEEDVQLPESTMESYEQNTTSSSIPDVRPTGQKGMGLKSLKTALSLFSTLPVEGVNISNASPEERREIQAKLENDAVDSAIDRWRKESIHLAKMGLNTALQTKSLGGRMWKWQLALEAHLKEELVKIDEAEKPGIHKSAEDCERCLYGPFLRILPPQKLAAVTILSTMSTLGSQGADKGVTLSNVIMAIAKNVEDESTFETLQRKRRSKIWPTARVGKNTFTAEAIRKATRGGGAGAVAKYANRFLDNQQDAPSSTEFEWPMTMRAKVGAFLMSALIEVAQVPVTLTHPKTKEIVTQMQPAFAHSFQYKMGKKLGVVTANKAIVAQMKREPVHSLLAKHLPMLVEPEPWTLFNKGGFISHPGKIMRIKSGDKDQRHYVEAAVDQGDMKTMFEGLNALGRTPWRINQPVFDVMLEAWNSGEAIANIPAENPNLSIPPEPESSRDPLERRRWIRAVKNVENSRSGMHSQRCFQNFQLEIARALRSEQFYFPHNIDFRGRAYPIPPYLNHMGADHCRGLLKFGKGRELGDTGLKWLKIHLSNVYGFDKASLSERQEFSMKNLNSIVDSATNPLKGDRWWLQAEDPWQCLAACIELNNALNSPDPTRFVSHLPVHQDGTCNGLQHYAALGGDVWGAKQVNLEPGDRPADVYTAVAELVKAQVAQEKDKGNPLAMILDGKITRKTVKQTVMTNVYGVTYVGAKAQVRKQLVAAYPDLPNNDKVNPAVLSSYIATRIFTALSTMFKGAHDIQHWLGECASRISTCLTREQLIRLEGEWSKLSADKRDAPTKKGYVPKIDDLIQFKSSVIWTNPVHMPVVQPYRNSKAKSIATNLQRLSLSEPHRSDPVSKRKQLQGFPPNFIHSLDATHMILSALQCDELGLSFAAVHDSFWTHASDVGTMNKVLRDSFIQIHSDDVIGRLGAEFAVRYSDGLYLRKIPTSSPAYKMIIKWRAARTAKRQLESASRGPSPKGTYVDELRLEYKRQELLRSEDPRDVEKGKAMVTGASIFEEVDASGANSLDAGLELAGLGDVSSTARSTVDEDSENESRDTDGEEGDDREIEEADSSDSLEETTDAEAPEAKSAFEKALTSKRRTYESYTPVWLPLTFPPVPKKGEFDVSRLKNSDYFFS